MSERIFQVIYDTNTLCAPYSYAAHRILCEEKSQLSSTRAIILPFLFGVVSAVWFLKLVFDYIGFSFQKNDIYDSNKNQIQLYFLAEHTKKFRTLVLKRIKKWVKHWFTYTKQIWHLFLREHQSSIIEQWVSVIVRTNLYINARNIPHRAGDYHIILLK